MSEPKTVVKSGKGQMSGWIHYDKNSNIKLKCKAMRKKRISGYLCFESFDTIQFSNLNLNRK